MNRNLECSNCGKVYKNTNMYLKHIEKELEKVKM